MDDPAATTADHGRGEMLAHEEARDEVAATTRRRSVTSRSTTPVTGGI
jgi:hypothetical protein